MFREATAINRVDAFSPTLTDALTVDLYGDARTYHACIEVMPASNSATTVIVAASKARAGGHLG